MPKSEIKKDPKQVLKEKIYFISAIGTDIGKTYLVKNICQILRQKEISVSAIKPVISGFLRHDKNSDSAKILTALGLEISQKNLDSISPWRFEKAVSPHFAGEVNFSEVRDFCLKKIAEAKSQNQFLFIEAAGGVMTPLNNEKTFLDLAAELQIPTLLLSANYLGSISHTLCALEVLKSKKVLVEKIILNENLQKQESSSLSDISEVGKTIQNFSGIDTVLLEEFLEKLS